MKSEAEPTIEVQGNAPGDQAVELTSAQARRIRVYSRMGLWGLTAGLLPPAYYLLELPRLPWSVFGSAAVSGLGFLVGGVGTLGASILVLRKLKGIFRPLKLAALVGVPFGLSLGVLGLLLLGEALLPPGLFLGAILDWTIPAAFFLGVALAVLLIGGFVIEGRLRRSPEPAPGPGD